MLEPHDAPRRKRLRLREFDYSSPGAYFVTTVTRDRELLFGEIVNEVMVVNESGYAVQHAWDALPRRCADVMIDEFVIMPNHVHGIVWLLDEDQVRERVRAEESLDARSPTGALHGRGAASSAPTLGVVMRAFKSTSAIAVNRTLGRTGAVWQRNYFERVIRNDRELHDIRQYIIDNPAKWALDEENRVQDALTT